MDALYDRNHQNLIAQIRNTTQSRVQVYPDFAPTTLPKYHVTLSDILKIAPQNDIESLYSLQQQYRQADANRQVYAKANADRLNTQIEIEKLKLSNPLLPQEEVEKTYDTIKELKLRSLDQFDPQFVAKSVLINKDIETQQESRDRELEKEARLVYSTISQIPAMDRAAALGSTDKNYWRKINSTPSGHPMAMTTPSARPPAMATATSTPATPLSAKTASTVAASAPSVGGGGSGGGGASTAAIFGSPPPKKTVAPPPPQIYVPTVPVPPPPPKTLLPQQGGLQVSFVPAAPFYAPTALPSGPTADGKNFREKEKLAAIAEGYLTRQAMNKWKEKQGTLVPMDAGPGSNVDIGEGGGGGGGGGGGRRTDLAREAKANLKRERDMMRQEERGYIPPPPAQPKKSRAEAAAIAREAKAAIARSRLLAKQVADEDAYQAADDVFGSPAIFGM